MAAAIAATGISQRFGRRTIFRDVSFSVETGEVFVILGGSGCGKSTVMRQLIGLLPPTAGMIEVLGHRITGPGRLAALRDLRRTIGVMFQSRYAAASSGTSRPGPIMKAGSSISPASIEIAARSHSAVAGQSGTRRCTPAFTSATVATTMATSASAATATRVRVAAGDIAIAPNQMAIGSTAGSALWRTAAA